MVCHVGKRREEGTLDISVDSSVVVKAVDGSEDGADDGGGVVLGQHAPCEDEVKIEVSARLEAL